MAIIGIDLGTTNSLASVWKDGKSVLIPNAFGKYLTPSAVSIDEHGNILVGQIAKERLISYSNLSVSSFKRYMGTDKNFCLGKYVFNSEELSALVLKQLKQDAETFLGQKVSEAIISVPAYFNDRQRNATKRAGEIAGLIVERLVNEPSAAALYCNMLYHKEESSFLVFDFGGGTLDVSLVDCFENIINIVAVSGDNNFGGDDFDLIISKYFCKINSIEYDELSGTQKEILKKQSELCKIALSSQETVLMIMSLDENRNYSLLLNNKKLIQISTELLLKMEAPIKQVLMDSQYNLSSIDDVILIGGSSKMPLVKEYLSHILKRKVSQKAPPETAVALGLGAYSGIKQREDNIKDIILTDVCPFTLGIATYNQNNSSNSLMFPIIERNSTLPSSKEDRFTTVRDNQKKINIEIYQGENIYAEQNLKLGEILFSVPPALRGQQYVDVRFSYDINGILEVNVSNEDINKNETIVIVDGKNKLSKERVKQSLVELSKLKTFPAEQVENKLIIARAESLYAQTTGKNREDVTEMLNWFNLILASQEKYIIEKARKKACDYLDLIDENLQSYNPFDDNFGYSKDDE